MPGFLGGGTSSGGVGGEILFAKEFIDPVTKLRVSQPENLIDTDFEYGLQPTKWETVELINNTPSFFSKSGDTTIDGITSITTNAGTREITVKTALEHGLAVGIPIQVTGTKSLTADGSYIINSIPDQYTFTYLCKDNQPTTAAIEDLYSSIITGEFFQGSQLRISDADGIVTDGTSLSVLTVKTESTHGFGVKTPFYFLNLNSTISQEFPAANTTTKSFDASNSATAQTFDGSNTLSSISIDFSNSAVSGGATSTITSTDPANDTITVSHGAENFANLPLGAPLYYDVLASSGFFAANPRGVVFLKSTNGNGTLVSAFQVSEVPDGPVIDITGNMSGTFQSANQARTFAGNNVNPLTQVTVNVIKDEAKAFDGDNTAGLTGTIFGYSGSLITVESATELNWYVGTMVFYSSTGAAATNLTNNTTYFVDFFSRQGSTNFYTVTLKPLPDGSVISGLSKPSGVTETLQQIGVSLDKNVFHLKDHGYEVGDMLEYSYPVGGHFGSDQIKDFYFIQTRYDSHNFTLTHTIGEVSPTSVSFTGGFSGTAITPQTITTVGFTAPISWSVTSGILPTGLSLNTSTGTVSGTPSENIASPGRTVIITATDSVGAQASVTYTFQFNQPPELYSFSSASFGQDTQRTGNDIGRQRQFLGNPSWANNNAYLSQPWYTGYNLWTVPSSATYRIRVAGGTGARRAGYTYGRGAVLQGDIALTQGQKLFVQVGSAQTDYYNGGGMSSVALANESSYASSTPLIVAGGGGGYYTDSNFTYSDANPESTRPYDTNGYSYWGASWGAGQGGAGYDGGSGGGWNENGRDYRGTMGNRVGRGWVNGCEGGYSQGDGGFGGGGGYHTGYNDAGGGGGYSGGDGGGPHGRNGRGGGSYFANNVTNRFSTNGGGTWNTTSLGIWNNGNGYITITKL